MLVTGQSVNKNNQLAKTLLENKAINIYKKLIKSFRGSMLVKTLPLTTRLLILTKEFNSFLEELWDKETPSQFASDEASKFIEYLEKKDLDVPYLKEVLAFEKALLMANIESKSSNVTFNHEPLLLLNALAERRLPPTVREGRFSIEVTPNKVTYKSSNDDIILYKQ